MIAFRPLTEDDFEQLSRWLATEHVQLWWKDPSAPWAVEEKYGPRVRGEAPTEVFVVSFEGVDVGMIQRYRIADHPDWLQSLVGAGFDASESVGIDYMLGDFAVVGRGVGTDMIRRFTDKVFTEFDDIASIAVDPQATNVASCRALKKAGYEQVWCGILDSDDPSNEGDTALHVLTRSGWERLRR